MEAHREKGDLVLLLSASPDSYMKERAKLLPVDLVLASPTDEKGRVSRTIRFHEKVKRMREWEAEQPFEVDWPNSWAYGDSATDLPVMRLTGHPTMVNPAGDAGRRQGLPQEIWRP